MPSKDKGFRGISIKKELLDEIERFAIEHKEYGYKSKAEFVTDAIRRRLEELKRLYS